MNMEEENKNMNRPLTCDIWQLVQLGRFLLRAFGHSCIVAQSICPQLLFFFLFINFFEKIIFAQHSYCFPLTGVQLKKGMNLGDGVKIMCRKYKIE